MDVDGASKKLKADGTQINIEINGTSHKLRADDIQNDSESAEPKGDSEGEETDEASKKAHVDDIRMDEVKRDDEGEKEAGSGIVQGDVKFANVDEDDDTGGNAGGTKKGSQFLKYVEQSKEEGLESECFVSS